ncbi:MAG: hypothetical protein D6741_07245, partial [Planctomycetota bacterium]
MQLPPRKKHSGSTRTIDPLPEILFCKWSNRFSWRKNDYLNASTTSLTSVTIVFTSSIEPTLVV